MEIKQMLKASILPLSEGNLQKMICPKKFPKTINKARAQIVKFMRKKKRYVPPHITERFHGVVQTPG